MHRRRHYFEEMDGEALVYRHAAKQGIYLNGTATVIWRLCDGTRSVDEIIRALSEIYPDQTPDITSDVYDTIDRLVGLGALKLVEPSEMAEMPGHDDAERLADEASGQSKH